MLTSLCYLSSSAQLMMEQLDEINKEHQLYVNMILDKGKLKSLNTGKDLLKIDMDVDILHQLIATLIAQSNQKKRLKKQLTAQEKAKFLSLNALPDSTLAGQYQPPSSLLISDTNIPPVPNILSYDKDSVNNNKKLKMDKGVTGGNNLIITGFNLNKWKKFLVRPCCL
ncbi:hypothetical protein RCL_jg23540.t1 [Rhizophagus clarus]|uniref:Uncharacterized protein n=1 Tax=Rhizophagus clarus TaxID=94130 RepID=A0A8H3KZW1_9GLOM|nr:hypothetical protein RCL_jg23540.t1 [Rhizophagus clarus]